MVKGRRITKLSMGTHASPHDYDKGRFITEKDFLQLLVASGITVCDLGAGTASVLYKGERHLRPSMGCRTLPPSFQRTSRSDANARKPLPPPPIPPPPLPGPLAQSLLVSISSLPSLVEHKDDDDNRKVDDEASDGKLFGE